MAVTADASGTQTATIGTEHTLDDVALAGTYTFHVDTTIMAAGDVLELRIYQIILTGGTRHVAYMSRFVGVQPVDDAIKLSVPISNELTDAGSLRFTLKQTLGTGRAYPWKVLKYA
jgi:hypothetical protein